MRRALVLAAAFCMCSFASAAPPKPTSTAKPEVIGGVTVKPGAAPWQVALIHRRSIDLVDGVFCGGTLVGDQWVLTAAHCMCDPETNADVSVSEFWVLYGSVELAAGASLAAASEIVKAPGHQCTGTASDLALLKLRRPIAGAQTIRLATDAEAAQLLKPQSRVRTSGWGYTKVGGQKSRELLEVSIPIVSVDSCKAAYGPKLPTGGVFCAGEQGKDSCTGDSGGPLYFGTGKEAVQLGVVSFGDECGKAKSPGVYASVATPARQWIQKVIAKPPCRPDDRTC